jgi:multidrug efflux system membrane fusion protein
MIVPSKLNLQRDQAVLLKDKALETSLAADLSRAQDLAKKGAGTAQAYDQALAAQKAADATLGADQAAIDADHGSSLTIPGFRLQSAAAGCYSGGCRQSGGSGSTGNLVTITQMMHTQSDIPIARTRTSDIRSALRTGQTVPVHVLESGTTKVLESGSLDFIDSTVDKASGTIAMSATIDNDQLNLWPGQYVDVEVDRGELTNTVVVPTVAVQQGQTDHSCGWSMMTIQWWQVL